MTHSFVNQTPLIALLTLIVVTVASFLRAWFAPFAIETIVAPDAPLGMYLVDFQRSYPVIATIVTACLVIQSAIFIGRLTIRFGLYSGGSLVSVSLFCMTACGIYIGVGSLADVVAMFVTTLSLRLLFFAVGQTTNLSKLFWSMFLLGAASLFYAQAAVLFVLLVLAAIMFKFSARETIVAVVGFISPLLAVSYVGWAVFNTDFLIPARQIWQALTSNNGTLIFSGETLGADIFGGYLVLLAVASTLFFFADIYSAAAPVRRATLFLIISLFVLLPMIVLPGATVGAVGLIAIPLSLVVPIMLVRVSGAVGSCLYMLLVALLMLHFVVA